MRAAGRGADAFFRGWARRVRCDVLKRAAGRVRGDRQANYTGIMSASRVLITLGVVLIAAGILIRFAGRLPFKLGRLPGDIFIQGRHSSFYFPVATCIVVSVVLSLVLWALRR